MASVITAPRSPVTGMVNIHANTMLLARAHLTADNLLDAPTPMIAVDMT